MKNKKHIKRVVSVLISTAMVFSFSNFALAYNTESSHVFEAELSLNTSMINEVFGVANDCAEPANVSTSDTRSISIYIENEMAHLSLTEDGNAFNGTLTGRVTPINTSDNLSGYAAAFKGYLTSPSSNTSKFVFADVTYNEDDMFAIITKYNDDFAAIPALDFYGILTDELASIANTYSAQVFDSVQNEQLARNADLPKINGFELLDVDAQTRLKSYDNVRAGTCNVGTCYLFHANELINQGSMTTYVKVNTNTEEAMDHITFDRGEIVGLTGASPEVIQISLSATPGIAVKTNTYLPANDQRSITFNLPVWYEATLGFVTVPFSIVTSSTSVSTFKTGSSATNNNISWSMYKLNGWEDELDGTDASSTRGIGAEVQLGFEGTISQQQVKSISGTVTIDYVYSFLYAGNELCGRFAGEGSLSSAVYVLP